MNIVQVTPHHSMTIQLACKACGRRCYAPAMRELTAPFFDGGTNRANYQRAWADLDAPAGTFYCTDCANDLDSKKVSGI